MSSFFISKCLFISFLDTNDEIVRKIKKAKTDPTRGIAFDAENRPEIANLLSIFRYHFLCVICVLALSGSCSFEFECSPRACQ